MEIENLFPEDLVATWNLKMHDGNIPHEEGKLLWFVVSSNFPFAMHFFLKKRRHIIWFSSI